MKRKRRSVLVIIMVVIAMTAGTVFAAAKPYKDVTVKKVGKDAYSAIVYVKAHKGYTHVIKGKKFKPYKKITRREFLTMLGNFYGDEKVPVTMSDVRYGNAVATEAYATSKMVGVAKKGFGMTITWDGGKKKLTRALASQYIKVFAFFDSAFKPRR